MSAAPFITYRRFQLAEEALYYTELFTQHGIPYEVEDDSPPVDITFSGSLLNKEIRLKLKSEDFPRADDLLRENLNENLSVGEDHYLSDFSNEELYDVFRKYDEWSMEDLLTAREILKRRGVTVEDRQIEEWKEMRLAELRKPKSGLKAVVGLFLLALLGGWLGALAGLYLFRFKRTLPNGEQVWMYDDQTRRTGKFLMILGISWFVILLVLLVKSL